MSQQPYVSLELLTILQTMKYKKLSDLEFYST